MKYTLSENLINSLVNYLAKRPYQETFELIHTVQQEIAAQAQQAVPAPATTDNVATLPTNEKTQKQAKA